MELENKESLLDRQELTIGGIVTNVRNHFDKKGNPCGFVTIEDYDGAGEMPFFGEQWGKWSGMLQVGSSVYVNAKCSRPFQNSNYVSFNVSNIQLMSTVKETRVDHITISMKESEIDTQNVDELCSVIDEYPGDTDVYLQIHIPGTGTPMTLRSRKKRVELNHGFISYLDNNDLFEYDIATK